MATIRQKKLAEAIIENAARPQPLAAGKLLANVGYAKGLIKQPKRIIEQVGVQEELKTAGFTSDNAKMVVTEILLDSKVEPNARLKAGDMVFKVHGDYAPEKSITMNINTNPKEVAKYKAIKDKYEQELVESYAKKSANTKSN